MNKSLAFELFFGLVLTVLIVALYNPWSLWMPMEAHVMIVGMMAFVFGVLSVLAIKSINEDEREQKIRLIGYQTAYGVGTGVIIMGIMVQSFRHSVDSWLVGALLLMLAAKFITILAEHKK